MSTTVYSSAALADAADAIHTFQAFHAGKAEHFLNTIGDKAVALSASDAVVAMEDLAGSAAFNMVKEQVSHFAENTKMLVGVLDEIGKAHPFILIAVCAFKAAITLELTRRENDQKIIALNATMCDMMQVMTLLKDVAGPTAKGKDGVTVSQRLQGRMGGIIDSIKRCAKVCDSYQKRHTAVKFFTSTRWKTKFGDVAAQFAAHKSELQADLQLHVSITVTKTHDLVTSVDEKMNAMTAMMELVFERMQTPEERELAAFAQRNGGPDRVLENGVLMKKVLEKQKVAAKEDKGATAGKPGAPAPTSLTLSELEKEIRKDVDSILEENTGAFERKFGAIELSLREVNVTIERNSDRVISEVLAGMQAGPHERIKDRDLYNIWKEMGWKGSVKATHFVIALHDHFSGKAGQTSQAATKNSIANPPDTPVDITNSPASPNVSTLATSLLTATLAPETQADDLWTLQYINVRQIQPLIEAIDDDGSSFVTVSELNDFTSSRPKGWSLPRWIAYWTIGFEMTTNWYWRRIQKNLVLIYVAFRDILPANRSAFCFYSSWSIESIISGLQGADEWGSTDWENDKLFSRFREYVLGEEKKLKNMLRRLAYNIDQDNTLHTLTGGSRPEKHAMPLLCLLLERMLWTMNIAKTSIVSPKEFSMLDDSIWMVVSSMRSRCLRLQAIYQLQNYNKKEKLERAFFGLYSYISEYGEKNDNWTQFWGGYTWLPDPDLGELEVPEPPMVHQAGPEEMDLFIESSVYTESEAAGETEHNPDAVSTGPSLIGAWSGTYDYQRAQQSDGLVSLSITEQKAGGAFGGSGIDGVGAFTVAGTIADNKANFTKSYTTTDAVWKYIGVVDTEMAQIVGRWGPPDMEDEVLVPPSTVLVPPSTVLVPPSTVEGNGPFNPPEEQVNGNGPDKQESPEQTPLCDIEITVEKPDGEDKDEEAVGHDDRASEAGSVISSTRTDAASVLAPRGAFCLVRRPVDYFLYRPSDAEFQESRPKALWKMVRNAARQWYRSHHLTWDTLCERRDRRLRYMQLLLKQEELGVLSEQDEVAEWAKIIQETHPNDIRLWRAVTRFQQNRTINQLASCDNCGDSLSNSRLMCSDCTEGGWSNSIDLCADCWSADCSREADHKNHVSSHMLIQFRRPVPRMEYYDRFGHAKRVVDESVGKLAAASELPCAVCEKPITERPYWCCLVCDGTYVCADCNTDSNAKRPWLLQRIAFPPPPDGPHNVLHTLALAADSSVASGGEDTTDDRLGRLEKLFEEQAAASRELHERFENHEKAMEERMQEMFRLMHLVLVGRVQNDSA